MLNIITGRTGSGKTRYIRQKAADIAKTSANRAVIIVPMQFTFETQKKMLALLGNEKFNNIEIFSFPELAEKVLSDCGKITKPIADSSTRSVLMSVALDDLQDKIINYKKYGKNPVLIGDLVELNSEMKKCKIANSDFTNVIDKLTKPSLKQKLEELSLIFDRYDSMLEQHFDNDSARLEVLCDTLYDSTYFAGKTVFFDGFTKFSVQEYDVIECVMKSAENVFVTLCYDAEKDNRKYELFHNAKKEILALKERAEKSNIQVVVEQLTSKPQYKAEALNILEENVFRTNLYKYNEPVDVITLAPCRTKNDEACFVASEIKRLVREEKYRYRDIAVIERAEGSYRSQILSAFRKYDIECFEDSRQPIMTQPLMVFMVSLFDILTEGFKTENVLRMLKTGLYGFSLEEIAKIEDYVLIWQTKQSEWKNDWTNNPAGFGKDFSTEEATALSELNDLRKRIVGPILELKNKISGTTADVISVELFKFLEKMSIDENLKALIVRLDEINETELALEQGRVWKILMDIFDDLARITKGTSMTLGRYKELFEIVVSTKDIGEIPNGIDKVMISSADRITADAPKAVFVVGANMGVFPCISTSGVILNDSERCELQENNIKFINNLEFNSVREQFIAYHTLSLATDKLYISYSEVDNEGKSISPSEIVTDIKRIFPKVKVMFPDLFHNIESKRSAFSAYAGEVGKNTVLGVTLKEALSNDGESAFAMFEKLNHKTAEITDTKLATKLFGEDIYASASKVEKFYKCPYSYFCEYGIKAKTRREAQLDAAQTGTFIHDILENFLRNNPKTAFVKYSDNQIRSKVNEIVDEYVDSKLSGYDNKPSSFMRTISLIKESAYEIIMQLATEFLNSEFIPTDFELSINYDGEIAPYVIKLDNGGTVNIVGKIDRVDTYEHDEKTYVRIVDYKSGIKNFVLSEVFEGLNLQMLIYLFTLWENGNVRYGDVVPAGILYFPARNPRISSTKSNGLNRKSDDGEIKKQAQNGYKMSGMVLNDFNVINAMEKNGKKVFIPAGFDKDGNPTGNVISLSSLQKLKERVNDLVKNMANELQNGKISIFPVEDGCKYCDYKEVCKHEPDDEIREIESFNFKQGLEKLRGDDDE